MLPEALNMSLKCKFISHTDGSCEEYLFSPLFVFPDDISKIDAARITKFDIEMFHHES